MNSVFCKLRVFCNRVFGSREFFRRQSFFWSQKLFCNQNCFRGRNVFCEQNLISFVMVCSMAWAVFGNATVLAAQEATTKTPSTSGTLNGKGFDTPQQAADAIVEAAEKFDVTALKQIVGAGNADVILSGEEPQDRERTANFAAAAREKMNISVDPKRRSRAFLLVGKDDWPFPMPIVKRGNQWSFDAKAGRQELLYRRIGSNELDAIDICHGYVEAQHQYALQKREGYDVNQYAQHIVSTPGKQD